MTPKSALSNRLLIWLGAACILIGLNIPALSVPYGGTVSLYGLNPDLGALGDLLAVAIALMAFLPAKRWVVLAMLVPTTAILITAHRLVIDRIDEAKAKVLELAGPEGPVHDMAMQILGGITREWGLAVLSVGCVLILVALYLSPQGKHRERSAIGAYGGKAVARPASSKAKSRSNDRADASQEKSDD